MRDKLITLGGLALLVGFVIYRIFQGIKESTRVKKSAANARAGKEVKSILNNENKSAGNGTIRSTQEEAQNTSSVPTEPGSKAKKKTTESGEGESQSNS